MDRPGLTIYYDRDTGEEVGHEHHWHECKTCREQHCCHCGKHKSEIEGVGVDLAK